MPDLPATLPVFCRLHREPIRRERKPVAARRQGSEEWVDEKGKRRRPKICEAFREGGARDWIAMLVQHWKLDDISLAELAMLLGISESQASRLRNHYSTSIGVLGQWAARTGKPIPVTTHSRSSAIGLVEALQVTDWLSAIQTTRPNRTPLIALTLLEHELYLLATMISSQLEKYWDSLTDRYTRDLFQAANDNNLNEFTQSFSTAYKKVTQENAKARSGHPVYFPNNRLSEESRWYLCRDIDQMWRKVHTVIFDNDSTSHAWEAVEMLTPWLDSGLPPIGG